MENDHYFPKFEEEVIHSNGDDSSFIRKYTFAGHIKDDVIKETLSDIGVSIEGYRCKHSYDCCGNYYPSSLSISFENGKKVAKQTWNQNI